MACALITCANGCAGSGGNYWFGILFKSLFGIAAYTMDGPLAKRRKQYASTCQKDWERLFSGVIAPTKQGDQYAWCVPCARDIKICASGVYDAREHLKTKLHTRSVKSSALHAPMTTFFKRQSVDVPESITTAEVLFSFFVAEHNLSANVSDHFTDLVRRLFPDSAMAKAFRCKRTKTTQIVRRCLAPTATDIAIKGCRDGPLTVMADESTDRNTDKRLAILVRYFEGETHTLLYPHLRYRLNRCRLSCWEQAHTQPTSMPTSGSTTPPSRWHHLTRLDAREHG